MMTVMLIRAVIGFALLGTIGVIVAVTTQFAGMMFLDSRLEARDQRDFDRDGWLPITDYPVVGRDIDLYRRANGKRRTRDRG